MLNQINYMWLKWERSESRLMLKLLVLRVQKEDLGSTFHFWIGGVRDVDWPCLVGIEVHSHGAPERSVAGAAPTLSE